MTLRTGAPRMFAGAVAMISIGSTFIAPPAEAWNPFSWVDHAGGSTLNRVVHGVIGGGLIVAGAVGFVAGLALLPAGVGAVLIAGSVSAAIYGTSMLCASVRNINVSRDWYYFFHPKPSPPGSGDGDPDDASPGANPSRGGPSTPARPGKATPAPGLGQTR